jgi:transcriptional regulator of met regulon
MNSKRITISIPEHVYTMLVNEVPERHISKFVSASVEEKLLSQKRVQYRTASDLYLLRDSLPRFSKDEIKDAIEKGHA